MPDLGIDFVQTAIRIGIFNLCPDAYRIFDRIECLCCQNSCTHSLHRSSHNPCRFPFSQLHYGRPPFCVSSVSLSFVSVRSLIFMPSGLIRSSSSLLCGSMVMENKAT